MSLGASIQIGYKLSEEDKTLLMNLKEDTDLGETSFGSGDYVMDNLLSNGVVYTTVTYDFDNEDEGVQSTKTLEAWAVNIY